MPFLVRRRHVLVLLLVGAIAALLIATGRPTVGWPSLGAQTATPASPTMPAYDRIMR